MLQDILHRVTPAYSEQSLQGQKRCEINCKEGMLHATIYLQLVSQLRDKLQEKLHHVTLA